MSRPITFGDVVDAACSADTDSANPPLYAIRCGRSRWFRSASDRMLTGLMSSAAWMPADMAADTVKNLTEKFPDTDIRMVRVSAWKVFMMWMRMESH